LKVLVTGGTGFIGSNLIEKLLELNYEVFTLIRPESTLGIKRLKDFDKLNFIHASVEGLLEISNLPQFDVCYNLASYGVDYRQQNIDDIVDGNVKFTLKVIDFCKQNKTKLLVHTGSSSEYAGSNSKITEDFKIEPHTLYGSAKAASVIMANAYAKNKSVNMITVRPFGIYGPREGKHKIVPLLIYSIIKNEKIELTSGDQIRDYLYIKDFINAVIELSISDNIKIYDIYNICSSKGISIRDISKTLCKICNYDDSVHKFGSLQHRINEGMLFVGDNSKLKSTIKWDVKYSLEKGLKETYEWYKDFVED
jgi:nucleoside-diphosphate-sugar epimerase